MLRRLINRLLGRRRYPEGIQIGRNVHIGEPCWLDWSHGRHITIEDNVTLAPGVRILCHDASSCRRLGVTWVAPVRIESGAFIGTESLILPGVTVGAGAVVAAGAVVSSDVPAGVLVAGVPAKQVMTIAELDAKRVARRNDCKTFPSSVYEVDSLDPRLATELHEAARQDGGYFLA
jgi:acetyltransferase-like isoleucine patch superfamily enzyme